MILNEFFNEMFSHVPEIKSDVKFVRFFATFNVNWYWDGDDANATSDYVNYYNGWY